LRDERLIGRAWRLFGHLEPGWQLGAGRCDFVHGTLAFGYPFARPTKTAWGRTVSARACARDYATSRSRCSAASHSRALLYGYLGDIGVPVTDAPMDFAGWLEAYIGRRVAHLRSRNNQRRIGRILIARGRDAADVAISTAFWPNFLQVFRVWTDEVTSETMGSSIA